MSLFLHLSILNLSLFLQLSLFTLYLSHPLQHLHLYSPIRFISLPVCVCLHVAAAAVEGKAKGAWFYKQTGGSGRDSLVRERLVREKARQGARATRHVHTPALSLPPSACPPPSLPSDLSPFPLPVFSLPLVHVLPSCHSRPCPFSVPTFLPLFSYLSLHHSLSLSSPSST